MQRCFHCGQYGRPKTHCSLRKRSQSAQRPRRARRLLEIEGDSHKYHVPWSIPEATTAGEYQYTPFDDENRIRILVLLPGNHWCPVRCELRTELIDNAPSYEAISYVWGDSKYRREILCHGRVMKITENLMDALRKFRRKRSERLLWADAVCIDQSNDKEKGHQVQMMGKVFERATRVLVWLGRSERIPEQALFNTFRKLARLIPPHQSETPEFELLFRQSGPLFVHDFREFVYYTPWFERMWTVQEICLAHDATLHYGSASIPWVHFIRLCTHICKSVDNIHGPFYGLWFINRVDKIASVDFQNDCSPFHILNTLGSFRYRLCSDPRDRIYALMGHRSLKDLFSNPNSEFYLSVDYSKSHTELYTTVATSLLNVLVNGVLGVLRFVKHDEFTITDCENIPSWVPQWDLDIPESPVYGHLSHAHGKTSPTFSINGNILSVQGLDFDTITWISDVFVENDMPFDLSQSFGTKIPPVLRQVYNHLQKKWRENLVGALIAMWATLTAGRVDLRHELQENEVIPEATVADAAAYFDGIGMAIPTILQEQIGRGQPDRFAVACRYIGRRVFVTSRGWLGSGPSVASVGNKICVLFGAKIPFVVWELPSASESLYRLCGECYVHGIMQGESIEMWESGKLEEKTFNLI